MSEAGILLGESQQFVLNPSPQRDLLDPEYRCVRLTTCASAAGDHGTARTNLRVPTSAQAFDDSANPRGGIEPGRGCPQRILRRLMPHQNRWLQGRTQPGSTVMPRRIVGPVVQRVVQDSLGEDAYRGRHAAAQKIAPTIMKV